MEKNEIELIQSYLTEEEAKVIIPLYKQNFTDKFRRGLPFTIKTPYDLLNYAFDWSMTDQGHKYWTRIYEKLTERYLDGH